MAARNKQDRPKKTASTQKSSPQKSLAKTGSMPVPESVQAPETQVPAVPPSSKTVPARGRQKPAGQCGGTVRASTFCLSAVLCLLLGTYLGTLLSTFRSAWDLASPAHRHSQPQLEEAVRKNPQDPQAWIQLGNRHFDDDKPREAIRAYEHALSIKGDNPDVLTDMGIMYRHLGDFERAAEIFTQASKIDSRHEQSRFNLGVVLFFDLDRKAEARKAWRELIGINPGAKTPDGALLSTLLDELK
jgi:cytochrome c-type biogenesis protein CcmH/NrfG